MKGLSPKVRRDVDGREKNPNDELEELLPSQVVQKLMMAKILSPLKTLL